MMLQDGNFSKSAGLSLSFHICPFFCSFNGMIIGSASCSLFFLKALIRSAVQALAGQAVLARSYLIPSSLCTSPLLSHTDKTRGHTRPPHQEKLLIDWPDFGHIGCKYSVLVQHPGKTQPEFCVSPGSSQRWQAAAHSHLCCLMVARRPRVCTGYA